MKMRAWLSSEKAREHIEGLGSRDLLFRAYALSRFVDSALYIGAFSPCEDWSEAIVPSDAGRELLASLSKAGHCFSPDLQMFTLFRLFCHRDLLVDHEATDLAKVLALLRDIHATANARWPYVFGNHLYHRFNDMYKGNETTSLEAEEADRLLDNTEQGVFQCGTIVSGPLGFFDSTEERFVGPTTGVALWHCSDPGCRARHVVDLEQHKNECRRARDSYVRHAFDRWGTPSEWSLALLSFGNGDKWPSGRPYVDLPAVIGDCLIGEERTTLCMRALRSPHNQLLTNVLRASGRRAAPPGDAVQQLSPEAQHQLLLLLPDKDLVGMVDEAVRCKDIRIPPSEVRRVKT
jgi:hypothetical protein